MPESVSFDDAAVVRTMASGKLESVRWDELEEVLILTTDQGPFVDDLFWVLKGAAGGCAVSSEAEGMDALLERLQQLPGFDNRVVIQAMGSSDNDAFLCWKRPSP